ncbi:MAG: beta-ketoacyl-[acyl-carrier-protein] synthase family protein [Kiritimatiellae bacterium]|nr:beta-ketoacyl-[acyl-carrier-protein] synthase family protein [Kiritimatiellia bacterium]
MNRPIAITGMGAITPYGSGVETLWQALLAKESAISAMDLFDLGGILCTQAGVIRNFRAPEGFEEQPRATAFAAAASLEALAQAGILNNPQALAECALITASNFGNIDYGEKALIPPEHPDYEPGMAIGCAHFNTADIIADKLGLAGFRLSLSLSCASGASAVVTAAGLITAGRVQRVVIVGYDALSRFAWSGLCALRTMSKEAVRPFDLHRNGTIFTEGAAAIVLEAMRADAQPPLAFLSGWASNNNGHHMTAPAPLGAGSAEVMDQTLQQAGLAANQIDHINTHGTGTKPNDVTETQAIQTIFGTCAASIPVTSIKGALGHMLGAAGAVELIAAVLSLRDNLIPPTAGLTEQDTECALDVVTTPRSAELQHVLSNSAGFGGCNSALVVSRTATPSQIQQANRIFITGSALITALGCDNEETRAALEESESACFPLERFELPDAEEPPLVGELFELEIADYGVATKPYLDHSSRLFLCACGAALREARHTAATLKSLNAGIMAGTAWGCASTQQLFFADFINKGPRLVKPFIFPHAYSNTAVSLACMEWSLTGAHDNITNPCIASGAALVEACDTIRAGRSKCMLAVGCDALSLPRLLAEGTGEPQGEAAAALVVEASAEHALAEIAGCGLAPDAGSAVSAALHRAGLNAAELTALYVGGEKAAIALPLPTFRLEDLCGELAGASTIACVAAALIKGLNGATLILTAEQSAAVAVIIKPC